MLVRLKRRTMSAIEKVVVFGATGNTGSAVVDTALKKGFQVTAFVRNPDLIPDDLKNKIKIIKGNVTNLDDVKSAVKDQHGVVVTLGTRNDLGPTTTMSHGTKNIIEAMKLYNVKHISLCISGFLFYDIEKVPPRFHELTADHQRQADVLKETPDLNWIAVCPPHISDEPLKGTYEVVEGRMPGKVVSKYDLADLLLNCLTSNEHVHKLIGIGYS